MGDSLNVTYKLHEKRGEKDADRKVSNFRNRDDRSKEDKSPEKTLVAYLFQSPVLSFCCMRSNPQFYLIINRIS